MKNGKHLELLDHLRGTAILAVLIFHSLGMAFGYDALPWKGWLRDFSGHTAFLFFLPAGMLAQAGVAIFFVVSGFCIHLSFETQGRRWGGFFVRRFFRIYPAYLLALLFSVVILFINPGLDFSSGDFWRQLLTHVFLVHNFSPDSIYGFNAALWSLAVEAQLYLLYPLLLAMAGRWGWGRSIGILGGIEVLIRALDGGVQTLGATDTAGGHIVWLLANSPVGYWFSWAIGAYIADSWINKQPLPFANASPIPWLALALVCHFVRPLYTFQFLLFAVVTAVIAGRRLSKEPSTAASWALPWAALTKIGLLSYSIYLLHQPLLHVYSHLIVWAVPAEYRPAPIAFFLMLVTWLAIIPLSALWYEIVEVPGIAVGKRISNLAGSRGQPANVTTTSRPVGDVAGGRRRGARYGLMAAALVAGVAATLLVSYQFSVRVAVRHSYQAWRLATDPEAAHRNGPLAVKLAEDACLQTQYRRPELIAILSAAYAEAGRFDEAIGAAQMAGKMASQAGDEKSFQQDQEMLKAFLQHQPFRATTGAGAN